MSLLSHKPITLDERRARPISHAEKIALIEEVYELENGMRSSKKQTAKWWEFLSTMPQQLILKRNLIY